MHAYLERERERERERVCMCEWLHIRMRVGGLPPRGHTRWYVCLFDYLQSSSSYEENIHKHKWKISTKTKTHSHDIVVDRRKRIKRAATHKHNRLLLFHSRFFCQLETWRCLPDFTRSVWYPRFLPLTSWSPSSYFESFGPSTR